MASQHSSHRFHCIIPSPEYVITSPFFVHKQTQVPAGFYMRTWLRQPLQNTFHFVCTYVRIRNTQPVESWCMQEWINWEKTHKLKNINSCVLRHPFLKRGRNEVTYALRRGKFLTCVATPKECRKAKSFPSQSNGYNAIWNLPPYTCMQIRSLSYAKP